MSWFRRKRGPKHCGFTWRAPTGCRRTPHIHRATHACALHRDHHSSVHLCECGVIPPHEHPFESEVAL